VDRLKWQNLLVEQPTRAATVLGCDWGKTWTQEFDDRSHICKAGPGLCAAHRRTETPEMFMMMTPFSAVAGPSTK